MFLCKIRGNTPNIRHIVQYCGFGSGGSIINWPPGSVSATSELRIRFQFRIRIRDNKQIRFLKKFFKKFNILSFLMIYYLFDNELVSRIQIRNSWLPTDPRIRIRSKYLRIHNTGKYKQSSIAALRDYCPTFCHRIEPPHFSKTFNNSEILPLFIED